MSRCNDSQAITMAQNVSIQDLKIKDFNDYFSKPMQLLTVNHCNGSSQRLGLQTNRTRAKSNSN
jgi:hypothetical protein